MRNTIFHWKAVAAVLLLVFCLSSAFAQTGAGSIQGTVTDPKGAMVPNATVTVVKTSTNERFTTVTNSVGFYSVPSLFVGEYTITISASGMSKWETTLSLQVGQTAVLNAGLQVGSVTSQVTVVADQTSLISTDAPSQGTTLERQRLEQIPMNGRSIAGLISSTVPGYEGGSGAQPRVNGLNWGAFSWIQDGASLDNRDGGGLDQKQPDPDSIQEVRVETSNSSAKFDRPGTAIISTKAGTNQFHGTAFETNRDNAYGIARNRQDTYKTAPKYIRNEYGFSIGGPILFPKLYNGRNKSFFFFSWEKLSLRQGSSQLFRVPTEAMRNGDFSNITTGNLSTPVTIYDPQTTTPYNAASPKSSWQRQAFPGNQIPGSRIGPLAKALYAITPKPSNSNNPYQASNLTLPVPNNNDNPGYTFRLDHHFSDKDTTFFRYTWGKVNYANGYSGNHLGAPTTDGNWNISYFPVKTQSGALSWNHAFSPTFYNEFVTSMNYEADITEASLTPNINYTSQLGIENNFGSLGFPNIVGASTNSGASNSILQAYGQNDNPRRDNDYVNLFDDNLTWIRGRHTMQFGSRYRHERLNIQPDQSVPAVVSFSGMATANLDPNTISSKADNAQNNTGLAAADFFMGYAQGYQNNLMAHYLHIRYQEVGTYFQDDYHIKDNLTLNLGLRWEVHPAIHEAHNQFIGFDVKNHAMVLGNTIDELYKYGFSLPAIVNGLKGLGVTFETPKQAGFPTSGTESQYFNVVPRLGAAWQPFGTKRGLVLRGGYGTYIYPSPTRNFYGSMNGLPPYTGGWSRDFANAAQNDGLPNYILRSQQTVVAGQNSTNIIDFSSSSYTPGTWGNLNVLDPHYPSASYREWNVTVEKSLPQHTILSVAYLGNHGVNLEQYWYTNPKPSDYVWYTTTGKAKPSGFYSNTLQRPYDKTTYADVQIQKKTGWSNSNSMQINFQRLYNRGYAFQVSYVFARNFRIGGNGSRDSIVYDASTFLPGLSATTPHGMNYQQDYIRDTSQPTHHVKYNWVLDLPVGRGKWLLPGANRFANQLVGGWQIAGTGDMSQSMWHPSTSDWGSFAPLHYYGRKYKVLDCHGGGVCYKAYLGYNGYIPTSQRNTPKGYQGLPASYTPAHQPLNSAQQNQWVNIPLADGTVASNVSYAPGPGTDGAVGIHPYYKTYLPAPWGFQTDASLFKSFSIRESAFIKFNADFFNVFNQQGTNSPDAYSGIISTTRSARTARQVQLTIRLTF